MPDFESAEAETTNGQSLAWVVVIALVGMTGVRALRGDAAWLLIVWGAYTPFVLLPAYGTLVFAVARKHRMLAVASLGLIALHLVLVVPQVFVRTPSAEPPEPALRVATMNGNGWNTHPDLTLRPLARHDADLLCLQEVSPVWADALLDGGWLDDYPHRHMDVREGVWGMALLSRIPMQIIHTDDLNEAQGIEATLELRGRALRVLCVHPAPPAGAFVDSHLDALSKILAWTVAHRDEPAVILGDLNSTPYSSFSTAMRAHVDDAWELAGKRGLGHTWPNGGMLYPPARLDHVYVTRSLGVLHAEVGMPGLSDHAPVVADIVLRANHE